MRVERTDVQHKFQSKEQSKDNKDFKQIKQLIRGEMKKIELDF